MINQKYNNKLWFLGENQEVEWEIVRRQEMGLNQWKLNLKVQRWNKLQII